jgi:hypothetical protein
MRKDLHLLVVLAVCVLAVLAILVFEVAVRVDPTLLGLGVLVVGVVSTRGYQGLCSVCLRNPVKGSGVCKHCARKGDRSRKDQLVRKERRTRRSRQSEE